MGNATYTTLCGKGELIHGSMPEAPVSYRGLLISSYEQIQIGVSFSFNRFEGECAGPTEVDQAFPWREVYRRVSNGEYSVTGVRQLVAEGHLVEARWEGKIIVMDGEDLLDHSIDFVQEAFTWTKDGDKHCYTENLRFKVSP